MVLIQLLLILMLWLSRSSVHADDGPLRWATLPAGTAIFLSVYLELVAALRLWSVLLSQRLGRRNMGRAFERFDRAIELAKYFVPLWLGVGIYGGLRWGATVDALTSGLSRPPWQGVQFPQLLLGVAPAILAWIGIWWADYPAQYATRENSLALDLEQGLSTHAPPTFRTVFSNNFRLQILFLLAPILCIEAVHDLILILARLCGCGYRENWANGVLTAAAGIIFICAPLLLRRILPAQRLADSPIRRRLENLCRRARIRYRDILVWNTQGSVGNAMVMGLFPAVRYILISDLLLERMTDQQIEAVFAHEMGHVAHRHLWWYVIYIIALGSLISGPLQWLLDHAAAHLPPTWTHMQGADALSNLIQFVLMMAIFLFTFAFFSQHLERQADVFSARMMQLNAPESARQTTLTPPLVQTYVGEYGAALTASALRDVARINHMSAARGNWLHGSIQGRINYLLSLSADQSRTRQFDQTMLRLFMLVLLTLVAFSVWAAIQNS